MNIILDKDEISQHLKDIIRSKRYVMNIKDDVPGVPHMIIFGSCLFELIYIDNKIDFSFVVMIEGIFINQKI
jgi:hypothetical protein